MRANPSRPFLRPTAVAIIAAVCSKLRVEPSSGRRSNDPAAAEAFWLGPEGEGLTSAEETFVFERIEQRFGPADGEVKPPRLEDLKIEGQA